MNIKILLTIAAFLLFSSCKKNNIDPGNTCFEGVPTSRQITNQKALIKLSGEEYFIIIENTFDSRLKPCNLEKSYQVNDLPVTVSGDVKSTAGNGLAPCCTFNFVITSISK